MTFSVSVDPRGGTVTFSVSVAPGVELSLSLSVWPQGWNCHFLCQCGPRGGTVTFSVSVAPGVELSLSLSVWTPGVELSLSLLVMSKVSQSDQL